MIHWEREKGYDIEILPIDRALNKEHLWKKYIEKSCRKCALKASPRPLNLKRQKSYCMQEILLKIKYFERGISNQIPFNGED